MESNGAWKPILKANMHAAFAAILVFYGWVVWQAASKEWWGLWIAGGISITGGLLLIVGAFFEARKALKAIDKIKQFQAKGVEPRADLAPDRTALQEKGIIR